jgi:hypothetical protein
MTFIAPHDRDYLRAKRIKQGQSRVDPAYDAFTERFRLEYGIAPLAVFVDAIGRRHGQGTMPRLCVVLERTDQCRAFRTAPCLFDIRKQKAVARLFTESFREEDLRAVLRRPSGEQVAAVCADESFVYFADFEDVAKQEVHALAAASAGLDEFTASLGIANQFWCTQRNGGPPIVFVHTDEQARALRASDLPVTWADTYFEIAKRHDDFGYLTRAEITIQVDSKENFETNYSSNWFYYFK